MRSEVHAISGATYDDLGNGRVRVHKGESYGIFDWEGRWEEGDITRADPHLLQYVGGPDLPPGVDEMAAQLDAAREQAAQAEQETQELSAGDLAEDAYTGSVRDPRYGVRNMIMAQGQTTVAKYVGDPGRDTPKGPRSKGISFHEVLAGDTYPERIPPELWEDSPMPGGVTRVPTERFTSQAWHDLEVEKLWKKVWQYAAHVDDIPEVGDYIVYDIAHLSYLVVRTGENEFKAYNNACLHRGRQIREFDGKKATEFRCPFHGWCWEIDGSLREIPSEWDFPEVREDANHLREAKVGTWGGFVFINPDPDCEPFEDFIGSLPRHYEKYEYEKRWKQMHVAKVIAANWKLTQEAFMEGYHVMATHPQSMAFGGDGANMQYDVFGNWCRAITVGSGTSPQRGIFPAPEEIFATRKAGAEAAREGLRQVIGDKADTYCDAEVIDGYFNNLFPNFHPWGCFSRIVYRFRPLGDDPDRSIMEVLYLVPWPEDQEKPPAAPIHWLEEDEDFTLAPEMGGLARVLNQDCYNLPKIQKGLKTKQDPYVYFSAYSEGKIRHFHELWDQYMGAE